jgi:hypothetical protein
MKTRLEVRMALHDSPPARPTAAWISRYAAGLLSATPGLQPLDAVRLAMDASAGALADSTRLPSKPIAHQRAIVR